MTVHLFRLNASYKSGAIVIDTKVIQSSCTKARMPEHNLKESPRVIIIQGNRAAIKYMWRFQYAKGVAPLDIGTVIPWASCASTDSERAAACLCSIAESRDLQVLHSISTGQSSLGFCLCSRLKIYLVAEPFVAAVLKVFVSFKSSVIRGIAPRTGSSSGRRTQPRKLIEADWRCSATRAPTHMHVV